LLERFHSDRRKIGLGRAKPEVHQFAASQSVHPARVSKRMDIVNSEGLWKDSLLFWMESDLSLAAIYVKLAVSICMEYEIGTDTCL